MPGSEVYMESKTEVKVIEETHKSSPTTFYSRFAWLNNLRLNLIRVKRFLEKITNDISITKLDPKTLPIIGLSMYGLRFFVDLCTLFYRGYKGFKAEKGFHGFTKGFKDAFDDGRKARMLNDFYWIPVTVITGLAVVVSAKIAAIISASAYLLDIAQDYVFKDRTVLKNKKQQLEEVMKIDQEIIQDPILFKKISENYLKNKNELAQCKDSVRRHTLQIQQDRYRYVLETKSALKNEIQERKDRRFITNQINIGLATGMAMLCIPFFVVPIIGQIVGLLAAATVLTFGVMSLGFRIWDQCISPIISAPPFDSKKYEEGLKSLVEDAKSEEKNQKQVALSRTTSEDKVVQKPYFREVRICNTSRTAAKLERCTSLPQYQPQFFSQSFSKFERSESVDLKQALLPKLGG